MLLAQSQQETTLSLKRPAVLDAFVDVLEDEMVD